jgi:hypothetical protein
MPFLRAAALNDAIEHLRNEGHEPVQVATNLNPSPCFDLDHYSFMCTGEGKGHA